MKNLRTFAIVDYLKTKKYCSLAELMEHFNVSTATIHRDIATLVKQNKIQKVHGGVATVPEAAVQDKMTILSPSFQERFNWNQNLKRKIAEKAFQQIEEGDILFLDSSTTVFFLAELLLKSSFSNLTIVTNSAMIIQNYYKFPVQYTLLSTGGTFDHQLNSFLGQSVIRELERVSITKAFLSAYCMDDGKVFTNHEYFSVLLQRVITLAKDKYLLIDHTKLGKSGLFQFANETDFAQIITEL